MTDTQEFEPQIIGKISEGILGDLDLYLVDLPSSIQKIHDDRLSKDQMTGSDVDEFYFLAPADQFGTKGTVSTTNSTTSLFKAPKAGEEPIVLWKAYFQHVATFIRVAQGDDIDLKGMFNPKSHVEFSLPKIPAEMVDRLDQFFRAVYAKHQTEAIVLLTYDLDYKDAANAEEGWGFGVPKQKNTGAHCDYEKQNVIESLNSTTRIVGTVHSHPGMSAHASSTDHNDQAGFDGIHITFGWMTSNGNVTEHYVELVQGENFYGVHPQDVMDLESNFIYRVSIDGKEYDVDPENLDTIEIEWEIDKSEMDGWIGHVEKGGWQGQGPYSPNQHANKNPMGGGIPKAPGPQGTATLDISDFLPKGPPNLKVIGEFWGEDLPDPRSNNFFVQCEDGTQSCPVCNVKFKQYYELIYDRRQCFVCGVLLLFDNETIGVADAARISKGYLPMKDFLTIDLPCVIFDGHDFSYKMTTLKETNGLVCQGGGNPKVPS